MVKEVAYVCAIEQHDIFQVHSIQFLPYDNENQIYSSPKANEIL